MAHLVISSTLTAIVLGTIPSVVWLFFWLYLARSRREPFRLLLLCFVLGSMSVFVAMFLQHTLSYAITNPSSRVVVWAAVEEVLKFAVFYIVAYKSTHDNEALDPAMYLIVVALGFATLENIFYIMKPAVSATLTVSLLTGGLRFFGSTLLHVVASCFIGIMITLSPRSLRGIAILVGITGATLLHSAFNFFIIKHTATTLLESYGFLWIAAIISHLVLEKFRRYPPRALANM